jgi:hypothetical protein
LSIKGLKKIYTSELNNNELIESPLFTPINVQEDKFKLFVTGTHLEKNSTHPNYLREASYFLKASADLRDSRGLWSYGCALLKE